MKKRNNRNKRRRISLLLAGIMAIVGTKAVKACSYNDTIDLLDTMVTEENFEVAEVNSILNEQDFMVVEEDSTMDEEDIIVDNEDPRFTDDYDVNDPVDIGAFRQPVIRAVTDVNIRKEPNTDCEILGLLSYNETLEFIGCFDGWYEVFYNGGIAYVSADYVELDYDIVFPEEYEKLVYMNRDTEIYSSNSYSNPISSLLTYDSAEVYEETNGFYLARTSDYVGFIPIKDTTELDDKVVVVDISSQKVSLYYDNKRQLYCDTVTGHPNTPTYVGLFSIYYMERDTHLVGDDYDVPVDVWMPFNGGIGLHDASWRYGVFGGDIYTYNGSHGCVNLPTDAAHKIYDSVDVGTSVLVHS